MNIDKKDKYKKRIFEIDLARGIAVVAMIISHIWLFGIIYCKNVNIKYVQNLNKKFKIIDSFFVVLGQFSYSIFILLVGVNMVTSYKNTEDKYNGKKSLIKRNYIIKNIKRALFVFILGIFMSVLVKWLFGSWYIVFGIFHFIALSIILAIPFQLFYKPLLVFIFIILIIVSTSIANASNKGNSVLSILIGTYNKKVLDYFPLLPYFAFVLIGIIFGNIYHNTKKDVSKLKENEYIKELASIGKHSIKIYFVHLSIIFLVIKILLRKNKIKV